MRHYLYPAMNPLFNFRALDPHKKAGKEACRPDDFPLITCRRVYLQVPLQVIYPSNRQISPQGIWFCKTCSANIHSVTIFV